MDVETAQLLLLPFACNRKRSRDELIEQPSHHAFLRRVRENYRYDLQKNLQNQALEAALGSAGDVAERNGCALFLPEAERSFRRGGSSGPLAPEFLFYNIQLFPKLVSVYRTLPIFFILPYLTHFSLLGFRNK